MVKETKNDLKINPGRVKRTKRTLPENMEVFNEPDNFLITMSEVQDTLLEGDSTLQSLVDGNLKE